MSKHTPGPWKVWSWPTNNSGDVDDDTWCYGFEGKDSRTFAEHEANARLMGAAPDLLAALKALSTQFGKPETEAEKHARAAIAKAEGVS